MAWWKKVIVMAGGPTVNLVLAFLLFGAVFMIHGATVTTTTIDQVSDCVIAATPQNVSKAQRKCTPADPVAPAKAAGLQPGDKVISFNGTAVTSWDQFSALIRSNNDGAATIVVQRDGERVSTRTNTTVSARPESANHPDRIVKVGFLGVVPKQVLERQGPAFVVTTMGDYTWQTVQALGSLPAKLVGVAKAAIGLQDRAADTPMSVVGASRVAGEVASEHTIPLSDRFFGLLALLGGINLFVGMFNFVPLLPLDGGHIAGALYEGLKRGVARLRGRPDPGHVDVAKLLPVAYVVGLAMLVMGVVLIVADLVVPLHIS
jgi:membrane-associated protease RseP (regulator of RpoE activity)